MKQGDSSSSAESKSAPAASSSSPAAAQLFKCKNCYRQFKTCHARCSHQITHRMASEMRMKPYGAVLGAVLIHHIPSDDEHDELSVPEPEPAPNKRTGSRGRVAQTKINAKGKAQAPPAKPKAKTIKKAQVLEKPDQPKRRQQQPQVQPDSEPQSQQTKDLLGEWSPMCIAMGGAEVSGSFWSWELTLDLAAARVSDETSDDDLDLELKLCSMNNKNVDLELKLGF